MEFMSGRLSVTSCNFSGPENKGNAVFNCRQLLKTEKEAKQFVVKWYVYTYICIYVCIYVLHIYFRWFISRRFPVIMHSVDIYRYTPITE
jgi:hypothetical protein